MATNFDFRNKACGSLTSEIGVYVLCDLDKTPIYVGQSKDGIRSRVRRHLTSARSDIIDGITQLPEPAQIVQVMSDAENEDKSDPVHRLPRQAAHYTQMVDHFLNVKKSTEILRAMEAHFGRLQRYHNSLVKLQEN